MTCLVSSQVTVKHLMKARLFYFKMDGWIKIHRSILSWEWYDDSNVVRVFLHLLLTANYEPKQWHGITIERGQIVTSVASLACQTQLSIKQIRIVLDKLKSTNEIDIKTANKYSIITICKYVDYQSQDNSEGQTKDNQRAIKGQSKGNQRATTKEIKNIRKKEYNNIDYAQAISELPKSVRDSIMQIADVIETWINYKKSEFHSGYKTAITFTTFLRHLYDLGNGNPETMKAIVEQSIANKWKGIFELKKTNSNGNNGNSNRSIQERAARIAEYAFAANGM